MAMEARNSETASGPALVSDACGCRRLSWSPRGIGHAKSHLLIDVIVGSGDGNDPSKANVQERGAMRRRQTEYY